MAYVQLNIPPLHTNNSHTDVPTSYDEACLISQFEQLHLRIDQFENRVSSDIGELLNQINQMFAQHSELIVLVRSVCPPALPQARVAYEEFSIRRSFDNFLSMTLIIM